MGMIALVTGAAGFIGSHLCEHLLSEGDEVRGVDAFTDYYARFYKERNLSPLIDHNRFRFVRGDLFDMSLAEHLEGVDVIYHLAGQPGVTASWGLAFDPYVQHNILATQRLLEACRRRPPGKIVFASSSSVYGDALSYPLMESAVPRPISPYGVTKLAAEQLCRAYQTAFSVPIAALRLFTVYGPRQRPDMAFSRLVNCALSGEVFQLRGDGEQVRDCTFVRDVVIAMRDAAVSDWVGIANVGGGSPASMNEVIAMVSSIAGPVSVQRGSSEPGDVRRTEADTQIAAEAFGYLPATRLHEGLEAMVESERSQRLPA